MLTWAGVILAVLQTVNALMQYVNSDAARRSGADEQIALVTKSILSKTAAGKKILEQVNAMSDQEVDNGLRGLEPRVP